VFGGKTPCFAIQAVDPQLTQTRNDAAGAFVDHLQRGNGGAEHTRVPNHVGIGKVEHHQVVRLAREAGPPVATLQVDGKLVDLSADASASQSPGQVTPRTRPGAR